MKYSANSIAAACYTAWILEGEQNDEGPFEQWKKCKKKVRIYNAHPAPLRKPLTRVTPTQAKLQGGFCPFPDSYWDRTQDRFCASVGNISEYVNH